jgi:hypothetical protein
MVGYADYDVRDVVSNVRHPTESPECRVTLEAVEKPTRPSTRPGARQAIATLAFACGMKQKEESQTSHDEDSPSDDAHRAGGRQ